MSDLKIHKMWVGKFNEAKEVVEELEILYDFLKEGESSESEVEAQYSKAIAVLDDTEFRSTLDQEGDELSCLLEICLLYTSPSPRDQRGSRMPSSA